MAQAFDRLVFRVQRLGRIGALGAALLAAAVAAELALVRPLHDERAVLAEDNERTRLARLAQNRADETRLRQDVMPLSPAAETALRRLFQAAEEEGLNLEQGDYRLIDESGAGRRRYQLTLPLSGPYPAIRSFLARSLNDDRALALNAVELRRETIEAGDLEANLRFTLYLGPDA